MNLQKITYKANWLAATILAIATILTNPLAASGEGGIGTNIKQIVINADEAGYKFTLSTDDKNFLKTIKVEWEGKVFEIGKEAFGQLDSPDFREFHINAPTVNSSGKQNEVIMILPYNRDHRGEGKESYNIWDVVRLHFYKGKLLIWEKAEAIKEKPGEWKLTSKGEIESFVVDGVNKVDKNGVFDNGSATSKKNPYNKWPIRER